MKPFVLLAFDPGGTTGWAEFVINPRAFTHPRYKVTANITQWRCGEVPGTDNEQAVQLRNMIMANAPFNTKAVTEDFQLAQLKGKSRDLLSPVRINALISWHCAQSSIPLHYQNRAARIVVTVERLMAYGFESPMNRNGRWVTSGRGKDAFSAMQHGIVYLERLKKQSISKQWSLES